MNFEQMINDFDWKEAFGFSGGAYNAGVPELSAGSDCSVDTFGLADVDVIYASSDGENDGPSWVCCGRLKDGRYFYLEAGCDYTGWDCQASGRAWVADSQDKMVSFAMSDEGRERLGRGPWIGDSK